MLTSEGSRPDEADEAGASGVGLVPDAEPVPGVAAAPVYATWGQRVVAALLDDAMLAGVTWLALGSGYLLPTLTPVLSADAEGWPWDPRILIPLGAVAVLLVLQALTGWTPGKLVVGIRVVREESSAPAGLWTTVARWALHVLDAVLLIGYLRPLWHQKRQTFADGIVRTVVVQQLPDLPRKQGIAVYGAALVAVVLGLGYCFPINSGSSGAPESVVACELEGPGPYLTTGEIALDGSVWEAQERRMWTVKASRTVHPGATVTWASDPSVRDVGYRVEIDARPSSEDGEPVISRSWDVGTGGVDGDPSSDGSYTHTRNVSPDGDVHVADVEFQESDGDLGALGTQVWTDVRLIADGEVVATCSSRIGYDDADQVG
ncbi:RDD family protein [Promicromonospora sp. NPDC023805]|uniref:RDD family protein n=1 Tax=Promicromonospora sp. NPDC023805 TaxID=3154696 RepID=UPI0033E73363